MYASEIPKVPVRKNLRPCCAFGAQLRVRLGPLPIPGYAIGNIVDREHIGLHVYDSGVAQVSSRGDAEGLVHSEHNGLIYTCRGGFIDTAHVRDYADWMIYVGTTMARSLERGVEAELPDEGGHRRIRLRPIDPDLVDRLGRRAVVIPMAQWLAYQLSVWHEIATWFGWSTTPLFSEKVSAFSPEDLYSNLLGARLAGAVAAQRTARDEYLYNRSLGEWLDDALEYLGATSVEVGEEAMASLDGLWWDSRARLTDPGLVRRRNLGGGAALRPPPDPPNGRIELERTGRMRIHYAHPVEQIDRFRAAAKAAARIFFEVGAKEVLVPTVPPVSATSVADLSRFDGLRIRPASVRTSS